MRAGSQIVEDNRYGSVARQRELLRNNSPDTVLLNLKHRSPNQTNYDWFKGSHPYSRLANQGGGPNFEKGKMG